MWTDVSSPALTPARVAALKAGQLYVNIHSQNFPAGEIRGQILPGPCGETCFESTIDGTQAGTGSLAMGTARYSLNHTQTVLTYNIEFSGLVSSETAAHIHSDAEGGGVVHGLSLGSPKVGQWTSTDSPALTPARVADLLGGDLYVNIHSQSFPAGEIRGQIDPAMCDPLCLTASLDGTQAGTGSPGEGSGAFVLNHTRTSLKYSIHFYGLTAPETAAHIHSDAEAGGVVHGLVAGSPKIGVWDFMDSPDLSQTRVADLLNGDLYVNIHSQSFPAGEIRGQLIAGNCNPTSIPDIPREETTLDQNYPNPFNPSTTIRFSLAERGRVTLRIYDVRGQLVRTLLDDVRGGVVQEIEWDGNADDGQPVATGIYFYRLVAGNVTATKKMVLLK